MRLMRNCLLFFVLIKITSVSNAQVISRINFDEIKKEISDSNSIYFYPNLTARLISQDLTLTKLDYKHLYYGSVFQENYHPYGISNIQKKFNTAYTQNNDFVKVENLGLEVLQENPVNLGVMLKMIFLYNHLKNVEKATILATIYVGFLEEIYRSGDGKTCEDSFVVLSVDDEYCITGDLGLTVVKQSLVGSCDRLIFNRRGQKGKNKIRQLYFNVKMPLMHFSKSYENSNVPHPDVDPDEEE